MSTIYNDNYGHQKGDRCLIQLSTLLREFGEKTGIEFFRYGGEEFIGVIQNMHDNNLLGLCHALNQQVFELKIPHKAVETEFVTISIGLSDVKNNDNNYDFKELLSQADNALYHAKANGRNMRVT